MVLIEKFYYELAKNLRHYSTLISHLRLGIITSGLLVLGAVIGYSVNHVLGALFLILLTFSFHVLAINYYCHFTTFLKSILVVEQQLKSFLVEEGIPKNFIMPWGRYRDERSKKFQKGLRREVYHFGTFWIMYIVAISLWLFIK